MGWRFTGQRPYLVAATDRAVERRPQVTALALSGARARTLRAVQVVSPLALGLVLAVVVGKMAESSYLVTGGGAVFWDGTEFRCCSRVRSGCWSSPPWAR
jgi:hypothetical protein